MIEVIRYQCEYCKKEFKTSNRHYCKKNPKHKNCYSCKYFSGEWEVEKGEFNYTEDFYYPICNHADRDVLTETWDYRNIQNNKWVMDCESWEKQIEEVEK